MDIIKLKDYPVIASLVKTVSKKQKAFVIRNKSKLTLSNTYWDEGSRNEYFLVNVGTKQVTPLDRVAPPQYGGRDPEQVIEYGFVVIEAGVSCGKPAIPTVYFPD